MEENLIEYLKAWNTDQILVLVDDFCYTNDYSHPLTILFIQDNDLTSAVEDMLYDKNNPDKFFRRSSWSSLSVLEDVKVSLLSIGFKRLLHERDN